MRLLMRFARAIDALNAWTARLVGGLLAVMVLLGSYNAVGRWAERDLGLRLASNAMLEMQWYLFALVFMLGAPHVLKRGEHVRVDVLYGGLPERGRAWIDALGALLFVVPFCAFAVWFAVPFAAESIAVWEGSPDPGGLPRWPLKLVVPLAFVLLGLQGLAEAIRNLAVLRGSCGEGAPPHAA
ncbi:MAG: TRAP transporter small permease subunit [Planctomycetes bacterium]|nr:TRAP transporter small permease subunit [Planctomycetota bacterium]